MVSYKRKNINFKSVKTNKHGLKSNKVIFYFFNGVFKSRVIINMLTSLTDLTNLLIKIFSYCAAMTVVDIPEREYTSLYQGSSV